MQILQRKLAVAENLRKQSRAYRFAGMNGDRGATAIGMLEKMVAPFDANDSEALVVQNRDEFFPPN